METLTKNTERTLGWIVIALVIASLMAMIAISAGCAGPRTMQGMAELQALEDAADADGVRTSEEAIAIATKQDEVVVAKAEEEANIAGMVTTGIATLLAGFLGVRAWRGPSTKGQ
jgi:hypothetical protein